MSSVFVFNTTEFELQLAVNNIVSRGLPQGMQGQAPQPIVFSFAASGGGDFSAQNRLTLVAPDSLSPQNYSFGIDPNLPAKVDVQLFIYQNFLALTEPSGAHTIMPLPPIGPEE
jgi:hypothetical protein